MHGLQVAKRLECHGGRVYPAEPNGERNGEKLCPMIVDRKSTKPCEHHKHSLRAPGCGSSLSAASHMASRSEAVSSDERRVASPCSAAVVTRRACHAWKAAMPGRHVRSSEQAQETSYPTETPCDRPASSWRHISCRVEKTRYYT